jgi:hypothetical protein
MTGKSAAWTYRMGNAPSQKEAEKRALQNCEGGVSKFKFKTQGRCAIMVSK